MQIQNFFSNKPEILAAHAPEMTNRSMFIEKLPSEANKAQKWSKNFGILVFVKVQLKTLSIFSCVCSIDKS